jgi:hypothetical protein
MVSTLSAARASELQIGLKITYLAGHLCRTESLPREVKDLDLICFLTVAVNTTVALFHSIDSTESQEVNQLGSNSAG